MTIDALPTPTTARWQPMRLGLVDLFYYDDEQFWFHDGRLLLRGNNGTGKSKVLALTLPFLLDGSTASRRVEPDADPHKRMEWNLLLGGAHRNTERTGYSWAEFGRIERDGSTSFTTIGIGMKAAAGRGIVKTWYFVSSRRIGDLRLVDDGSTVISQERLRDELTEAGSGQIFTTQDAYRRAVDEALFRLGDERYGALIDLLIQLRQPQLSKRPDEKALSAALTEALAPLDQAIIADVAESFRSLEEERVGIADAKDTLSAADDFLRHYRAYARIASRRHTTAVRLANSAYEHAGRELREAQEQSSRAGELVAALAREEQAAEERQGVLRGQEQALRASPEMREANRLDDAHRAAGDAEHRVETAREEAQRATEQATKDASAAEEATRRHAAAAVALDEAERSAARRATEAGLSGDHATMLADAAAADRILSRRREQVEHLRGLLDTAARATTTAGHERRVLDAAQAEAATRAEEIVAARDAIEQAVAAYRDGARQWVDALVEIDLGHDADEVADLSERWARTQSGEPPARAALDAASSVALAGIGRDRSAAEHDHDRLAADLELVLAEVVELQAGRDQQPQPTPARVHEARAGRSGAPLWLSTDFATTTSEVERTGIEAALQSAGLLDAWIFADGTVVVDDDVVLAASGPALDAARSLAAVLTPSESVDDAGTVDAVLRRIGWGEASGADLWIDGTGRWGAGPAHGAWSKDSAEFIGERSRRAHRTRLIAEKRITAAALEGEIALALDRIAVANRRSDVVGAERASYPAAQHDAVLAAHGDAARAERELARADERVDAARWASDDADGAARRALAQLEEEATDLALPTVAAELDRVRDAMRRYEVGLSEARASGRERDAEEAQQAEAAARAAASADLRERRTDEHRQQQAAAAQLRATYEELLATVGATVAELQSRLSGITTALDEISVALKQLVKNHREAAADQATAAERVHSLETRRAEMSGARDERAGELRRFIDTGLLRVALAQVDVPEDLDDDAWNVTKAVAVARAVDLVLTEVDEGEEPWGRAQQRVSSASTELASQMSRHGHTAVVEQHGDVLVERVRFHGDEIDIDLLAARLAEDVADRERLLSAREREILEEHLVGEVAGHLHELILTAEQQIDRMNRELAARKTSTGMQLRMRWRERPDGPTGLAAARDLLLRSDATWTADDRSAIEDFLQARIAEVREADPAGGWQEHLAQALDYRRWHGFVVERWQNGQWRSASGPASGGERALAVSVPLFAAASAHYNSADARAPRLILLDEAFAGVDDDSRAKSLGLLATFDLDVVMTSEREWGCYPQVPGLSIAQLTRVEGIDAVGVTRWRWDGSDKTSAPNVDAAASAGGSPPTPPDDMTLLG